MKRARVTASWETIKKSPCARVRSSLVEENVGGLQHGVGEEAHAAVALCLGLHLKERRRGKRNKHHKTERPTALQTLFPFRSQGAVFTFTSHRFSGKRDADDFKRHTRRLRPTPRPNKHAQIKEFSAERRGVGAPPAGSPWLRLQSVLKLHVAGKKSHNL